MIGDNDDIEHPDGFDAGLVDDAEEAPETIDAIMALSRDLRDAAANMTPGEARVLVDAYYGMQKMRIQNSNRAFAMKNEPHGVITWLFAQELVLEKQVAGALDKFSAAQPMGRWARSVYGIGPVLAAGLIAHIDIRKAATVGSIWRFAGLDPTCKWLPKHKRPYNASLKTLCWKIGDSFRKFHPKPKCVYGHIYKTRKIFEEVNNESGKNAEQCGRDLATRGEHMTDDQRAHYEKGRFPPGRVDLRASRYAVKQFLADMHHVWYKMEYGVEPPLPYPIAIMGHVHVRRVGESGVRKQEGDDAHS